MWKSLQHPNIVRFLGATTTMNLGIISEWMSNGTVTAFLSAHPDADRISLVRNRTGCNIDHFLISSCSCKISSMVSITCTP